MFDSFDVFFEKAYQLDGQVIEVKESDGEIIEVKVNSFTYRGRRKVKLEGTDTRYSNMFTEGDQPSIIIWPQILS